MSRPWGLVAWYVACMAYALALCLLWEAVQP